YTSRKQLLKVPRLGPKAYEQCAGFLRINGAKNPLDSSGVHPEAYSLVERMAHDSSCSVHDLIKDSAKSSKIDLQTYVSKNIGLPTLCDILQELDKPGRDPREKFQQFAFAENVHTIEDLVVDMQLPGVVTNVTKFGAFVDIGVHNDGLVHISQLADRFVKDPAEVVKPRQHVRVKVLEIDAKRKRISLSMRKK
ncbi:MAG: S1 RNA-binding domain-containing protein, partial [Desulfobulbaceae bacterium]|nr:S1 RNA-binding domain-containing protein [Desulfobulbaceae bacterium]